MKVPEVFICPCCSTRHPAKWAAKQMFKIQTIPAGLRSYGEETFYKSAKLQHIDVVLERCKK